MGFDQKNPVESIKQVTKEIDNRARDLADRLNSINESLTRELRVRGFDPAQIETAALPGELAKLYLARQQLLTELSELMNMKEAEGMTEVARILDQSRRTFDGEAWHGPSVAATLKDVTASQAAARPFASAHSIWELVLHIGAWEQACKRRLLGDPAQLSDEEDWPAVTDTSEAAWRQTKKELTDNHQELLEAIAAVDESRLDQRINSDPGAEGSSVYVTLHGVIQHNLYHLGQIAILKRALENRER